MFAKGQTSQQFYNGEADPRTLLRHE